MLAQVCICLSLALFSSAQWSNGCGYSGNQWADGCVGSVVGDSLGGYGCGSVVDNSCGNLDYGYSGINTCSIPAVANCDQSCNCAQINSYGPATADLPAIRLPTVVQPAPSQTIDLPCPPAPAPRVISNTCSCVKTVVKPQVLQRVVRIPSTIRYIKKSWVPVQEKINYCGQGLRGVEPSRGVVASAPTCNTPSWPVSSASSCGCAY